MKNRFLLIILFLFLVGGSAFALTSDISVEGRITATGLLTLESGPNSNIILLPNGTGIISLTGNASVAAGSSYYGDGSKLTGVNAVYSTLSGTATNATYSILSGTATNAGYSTLTGTASLASAAVTTYSLKSTTTTVDVSAATAPSAGMLLTASSGTAATWTFPVSVESVATGISYETITTVAGERVMVWAKGDCLPGASNTDTLTLRGNGTIKDTVQCTATAGGGRFPFSLFCTEVPGATTTTYMIYFVASAGTPTMQNYKLMILRLRLIN